MAKIRELDGLRGILAVWVVAVHLLPSAGLDARSFGWFAPLFGEHLRVQIFCILSGFVICLMFAKRQPAWRDFVAGRILRLYPAYILAFFLSVLMADIVAEALREAPFRGARIEGRADMLASVQSRPWAHILAHMTLLHGVIPASWLPHGAYAYLGQAWNISTEFQFYLVAPLLFAGLTTGPVSRRWAFAALVALFCLILRDWPNPADLVQYAPWFAMGIASYFLWVLPRPYLEGWFVTFVALLVFVAISMAAGIWVFLFGWLLVRRDSGEGAAMTAWLAHPALQWLGGISYSLYLLHMIPLYFGMYFLNGLGLDRVEYLLALSLWTFAFALPMAWVSAVWVEAPLMRGRPWSVPGRAPGRPARPLTGEPRPAE